MFSNKTFLTVFFLFCLEKSVLRGMYRSIRVLYVYPCRGDPWPKTCIPPFLYTTQIHARPTSFKCRAELQGRRKRSWGGGLSAFLYSRHIHFFWQRYIGGFCMWCCCIDLVLGGGDLVFLLQLPEKNGKIRRFSHRKNKCKMRKLSVRHTVTLTWEF